MEAVWDSYNLLGEGWGLCVSELGDIIKNSTFLTDSIGKNFIEVLSFVFRYLLVLLSFLIRYN